MLGAPRGGDRDGGDHIKTHYYASHRTINPTGIVPVGPEQDFTAPHGREMLVLSGRPIEEPIVQYGPFVMNSSEEIEQAFRDFQSNQFVSNYGQRSAWSQRAS